MADAFKKCYSFPVHLKFCNSGRLYLLNKVLLNLDRFYSILATIQYLKVRKSFIMDEFATFHKRIYRSISYVLTAYQQVV